MTRESLMLARVLDAHNSKNTWFSCWQDIQCMAKNKIEAYGYKRSKSRGPSAYSQDQAAQIEATIMAYS